MPLLEKAFAVVIAIYVIFFISSCAGSKPKGPPHKRIGWTAENFFDDPNVISVCHAIERKDAAEIERLIKAGVDVNTIGNKGMTLLLWSLPMGEEIFEKMLQLGADPNIPFTDYLRVGGKGDAVISVAASQNLVCKTMFHDISMDNYLKLVLKHGGNPNYINNHNGKSLLFILDRGNVETRLDQLIQAGCNLDHQDPQRFSAALRLASSSYLLTYKLLEAGADYRIINDFGFDLVITIASGEARFIKSCKERGIDYDNDDRFNLRKNYLALIIEFFEKEGVNYSAAQQSIGDPKLREYIELPVEKRPWFPEYNSE